MVNSQAEVGGEWKAIMTGLEDLARVRPSILKIQIIYGYKMSGI